MLYCADLGCVHISVKCAFWLISRKALFLLLETMSTPKHKEIMALY